MSDSPTEHAAARAADRPMSPFLIWRWHVTMATSILHRATGAALYLGALVLVGWGAALAGGPGAYGAYMGVLGSPVGLVVLAGLSVCLFFHMANGIRHLVWDFGAGFRPRTADATAWLVLAFGALAALGYWAYALLGAR
ncbi:MAG TPA: succinate dehydrogenase, cytochrome b556 subunit [Caulobacteraceae bacterium]|nr:succinate dehydrogenase, cytochrome b556 subunit [Caulobacteraceae bacterium]